MNKAMGIEERNLVWKEGGVHLGVRGGASAMKGPSPFRPSNWVRNNPGGFHGGGLKGEVEGSGEKKNPGIKKLTSEELQERQRKALRFRCGEKWNPEHACHLRNLQFVLMAEGEQEDYPIEHMGIQEEVTEMEMRALQLFINSYWGLTSNKSMKVWGTIGNEALVILVDTGATTNFISTRVVEQLGLQVENTQGFRVEVRNGGIEKGLGVCKGLKLQVQDIEITQHFFVLELGRTKVVLGMD